MESKSADLAKVKLKIFVGVTCRNASVFALAQDGHLYVYDTEPQTHQMDEYQSRQSNLFYYDL